MEASDWNHKFDLVTEDESGEEAEHANFRWRLAMELAYLQTHEILCPKMSPPLMLLGEMFRVRN